MHNCRTLMQMSLYMRSTSVPSTSARTCQGHFVTITRNCNETPTTSLAKVPRIPRLQRRSAITIFIHCIHRYIHPLHFNITSVHYVSPLHLSFAFHHYIGQTWEGKAIKERLTNQARLSRINQGFRQGWQRHYSRIYAGFGS